MRHIDHVVVAVRDLDGVAELYRRLGFQVGPRNVHPWGTENRLIQFGSSFIELITLGSGAHLIPSHQPRRFSFGAFVRDYLQYREGIAMQVLSSTNAESDADRFAEQGIGDFEPFSFERKAGRPDGSETQVAFSLAFANDPGAPKAGFFVCQQHFPEIFWNRSLQKHANLATNISAVTLSAFNPEQHADFLERFTGSDRQSMNNGLKFVLDGGRIELVPAAESRKESIRTPLLTSFSVRVDKVDTLNRLLTMEQIPFTASGDGITLAPTLLHGVELRFETETKKLP